MQRFMRMRPGNLLVVERDDVSWFHVSEVVADLLRNHLVPGDDGGLHGPRGDLVGMDDERHEEPRDAERDRDGCDKARKPLEKRRPIGVGVPTGIHECLLAGHQRPADRTACEAMRGKSGVIASSLPHRYRAIRETSGRLRRDSPMRAGRDATSPYARGSFRASTARRPHGSR